MALDGLRKRCGLATTEEIEQPETEAKSLDAEYAGLTKWLGRADDVEKLVPPNIESFDLHDEFFLASRSGISRGSDRCHAGTSQVGCH